MPTPSPRRALRAFGTALTLILLGTAARPASAQDVMTSVSAKHMESILSGMDLDFTQKNDHTWKFKLAGKNVLLFMEHDNTDAQLYIGFGDVTVTSSKMNEWNKNKRFARAYMDDDKNPVLEADLDFAGGTTDDIIVAWIKLFESQVKSYVEFLND
jgi:hypothetical protein